jgi:hypothetical protein
MTLGTYGAAIKETEILLHTYQTSPMLTEAFHANILMKSQCDTSLHWNTPHLLIIWSRRTRTTYTRLQSLTVISLWMESTFNAASRRSLFDSRLISAQDIQVT